MVISSCGSPNEIEQDEPTGQISSADTQIEENAEKNNSASTSEVSVDETVLVDQNGIKITLKSLNLTGFLGPELKILIENDSEAPITVQTRDSSVNGLMVETMMSTDVEPGKKANDSISFLSSEFEAAGIDTIKDFELKFHIFNSESWDAILDTEAITITTTADSTYVQTFDDSGTVVLDENGFKIVIKRLESENSFWGADLYLYVENKSGYNGTIQLRNTSINGFMVNPIFSCDVLDGKKAFDSISFLESDLTENGVTNIEEFEFSFHIFDSNNWSNDFDTEKIKVTF